MNIWVGVLIYTEEFYAVKSMLDSCMWKTKKHSLSHKYNLYYGISN